MGRNKSTSQEKTPRQSYKRVIFMNKLFAAAAISATTALAGTASSATTVDFQLMTLSNTGDGVMFTADNNTGRDISMITLTLEAEDGNGFFGYRAAVNERIDGSDTQVDAELGGFYTFTNANGSQERATTFKFTFDDGQASFDNFTSELWIQQLRVDTTNPDDSFQTGGIGDLIGIEGANILAEIMFADGSVATGSFLDDAGTTNKANVSIAPVPLPASALLLVAGVAGLGALRRFKRA